MVNTRAKGVLPSHRQEANRSLHLWLLAPLLMLLVGSNVFWTWHTLSKSEHSGMLDCAMATISPASEQCNFALISPTLNDHAVWGCSKDNVRGQHIAPASGAADTLVIYSFRYHDPAALDNLAFFMEFGIKEGDGARYIIAMDPTVPGQELPELPLLPSNAELMVGPNCFEQGMAGWVLFTSNYIKLDLYRYFVFVSSGVLGPLLPTYSTESWHKYFTAKISKTVKLVGCTISCTTLVIDVNQEPLANPHVQPDVLATDSQGLKLLKKAGALDCHNTWLDNLRFADFGASHAILKAGYNVDSMMLRYQAVDWQNKTSWKCNAEIEPTRSRTYDGTSLNPLEVIFTKSNLAGLVIQDPVMSQAVMYSEWIEARRKNQARNITSNKWISEATKNKEEMLRRPCACFDHEYYIMASPIEFQDFTAEDACKHFRDFGYREGRTHQYLC